MEGQSKKYYIFAYILIAIFIVFIFLIYRPKEEKILFTIETTPIPWLEPHEHEHHDSIMSNSHHVNSYSNPHIVGKDMWVKGFSYSIKNAKETVLHHAVLAVLNKKDLMCPGRPGRHLLGLGEDQLHTSKVSLPEGYAILIPRGSQLFFYTMLHNPKPPVGYGEDYYDVSSQIDLDLAKTSEVSSLKQVEFIRLDLTDKPCGTEEESYVFNVPGGVKDFTFGSSTEKLITSSYTFPDSGKIVYMGGHMHGWEGGKYVSVYINGNLIKKYETKKSTDNPYSYDTPHGPENILVKKGDVISITVTYDNKELESLSGAMGMLGLYFSKE